MTQQKNEAIVAQGPAEGEIAEYLRQHPDFFERHLPLLLRLKLPHPSNGSTVSLVERQVAMLRQRNVELERQLKDLVAVAKANNELVDNIHRLSIKLMQTRGLEAKVVCLEDSLREDFAAERAVLVLFASPALPPVDRPGFVKVLEREDAALKPFATFLRSALPRCGLLRDRQKALLFDREADTIVSAAMVPVGEGARTGFLAIGSGDAEQFHPGKGVDFLGRLGELVSVALESEYARADDGH